MLTPSAPAFLTNRGAEGGPRWEGHFVQIQKEKKKGETKKVSITLYLRNLTFCPFPVFVYISLPSAFSQREDLQGRWITICHIKFWKKKLFSIAWTGYSFHPTLLRCPPPPLQKKYKTLRLSHNLSVLFCFYVRNHFNWFEKGGPHCSL